MTTLNQITAKLDASQAREETDYEPSQKLDTLYWLLEHGKTQEAIQLFRPSRKEMHSIREALRVAVEKLAFYVQFDGEFDNDPAGSSLARVLAILEGGK